MSVIEISTVRVASMRQFHEIAFQGISAHARMHTSLIGVVGDDETGDVLLVP